MMASSFSHGKGNSLDMTARFSPSHAGDYLRLCGDDPEFVDNALSFMQKYPNSQFILRSDSTIEDSVVEKGDDLQIATFAGLFDSYTIEATMESIQKTKENISSIHDLATNNHSLLFDYVERLKVDIKRDMKMCAKEYKAIQLDMKNEKDDGYYSSMALSHNIDSIQESAATLRILRKIQSSERISISSLEEHVKELIKVKHYVGCGVEEQLKMAEDIRRYSEFRGADISLSKMNFVLQQRYNGINILIAEHPNIEGQVHMESLLPLNGPNPDDERLWFDENFKLSEAKEFKKEFYDIISTFFSIISNGRKEGLLRQDVAYMAEAIAGPQKIVQIRPYFLRTIVPEEEYPSPGQGLGIIPNEGFSFKWNADKKRYDGLHAFNPRNHMREDKNLPYDVVNEERVKVMTVEDESRVAGNYLSHQGIRNIEGVKYFQTYNPGLRKVWGKQEIRFSGENGIGSFSKLPKNL